MAVIRSLQSRLPTSPNGGWYRCSAFDSTPRKIETLSSTISSGLSDVSASSTVTTGYGYWWSGALGSYGTVPIGTGRVCVSGSRTCDASGKS